MKDQNQLLASPKNSGLPAFFWPPAVASGAIIYPWGVAISPLFSMSCGHDPWSFSTRPMLGFLNQGRLPESLSPNV